MSKQKVVSNITCLTIFALLSILFSTIFVEKVSASDSRVIQIREVEGEVDVRKAGGSKTLRADRGMELHEGDHLLTGMNSRAVLKVLGQEDEIFVGENTRLYISELGVKNGESVIKIWSGFVLVKANPLKESNYKLEIETTSHVMEVKGTHFQIFIDPATGLTSFYVYSGVVAARDPHNRHNEDNEPVNIYPSQQMTFYFDDSGEPSSLLTLIDLEQFVNQVDSDVIATLLKNKQLIDEENEAFIRQRLGNSNQAPPMNGSDNNEEDLARYLNNVHNLISSIMSATVNSGRISQAELEQIIEQVQRDTGRDINIDFSRDSLDLTERQKQELERIRLLEQQRRQQQEEKEEQRRRQVEQQQNLLERLEQQRKELEERNRQAAEDRAKEAQQKYLDSLSEQQRNALEDRMKQREDAQQSRDRGQPNAPSSPSAPTTPGGNDDEDEEEPPVDPPQNKAPSAKEELDRTLAHDERITLQPTDLAVDADDDSLSFVSASSSGEEIVSASLEGDVLNLQAINAGTAEVTVVITDGTDEIEVWFTVTVLRQPNQAPEARGELDRTLTHDERITLQPTDLAVDANDDTLSFVSVSSSAEEIVSASLDGDVLYLEAVSAGTAEVTVVITDGTDEVEVRFTVTVQLQPNQAPEAREELDRTLTHDERITLQPTDLAIDADGDTLSFVSASSSGEEIVSASLEGDVLNLQAINAGTADVTVVITDGTDEVEVQFTVTVTPIPVENTAPVAKSHINQTLNPNEQTMLLPEDLAEDADGDVLVYVNATSEDDEIVVVNLDGEALYVEAMGTGTTTVTVEISDGIDMVEVNFIVTVISPENHIYGIISAPELAPVGGIPLTISAMNWYTESEINVDIVLPEGKTSISYHIEIPGDMLSDMFSISYQIGEGFVNDQRYVPQVFYGETTEWGDFISTAIELGDNNEVDLSVIRGQVISGNVTIPQSASVGGEDVIMIVRGPAGFANQIITIPEGEQTSSYQLIVPPGDQYTIRFDYDYYMDDVDNYPQYFYLNINDLKEDDPNFDLGQLPGFWVDKAQVAIRDQNKASNLDLSREDQININLNIPMGLNEYEVITKNDMIIFIADPSKEVNDLQLYNFRLDDQYVDGAGDNETVIVELNAASTYWLRYSGYFPGLFEGGQPFADLKLRVTTTNEPQIGEIEVLPGNNELDLLWDAYPGASEYHVYLYERGTSIDEQFTDPRKTVKHEGEGTIRVTIDDLQEATNYVVRVEARDGSDLLAGTTLSAHTLFALGVEVDPSKGSLSWNKCEYHMSCYYRVIAMDQEGHTFTYETGRNDDALTMYGLSPYTPYEVWIFQYSDEQFMYSSMVGQKLSFESEGTPDGPPSSYWFVDIDPSAGELGTEVSKVTVGDAVYGHQVTKYVLYWANEDNEILGTDVDGDGHIDPLAVHEIGYDGYSYYYFPTIPLNTVIPHDAVKFLIYFGNAYGISEDYWEFRFEDIAD